MKTKSLDAKLSNIQPSKISKKALIIIICEAVAIIALGIALTAVLLNASQCEECVLDDEYSELEEDEKSPFNDEELDNFYTELVANTTDTNEALKKIDDFYNEKINEYDKEDYDNLMYLAVRKMEVVSLFDIEKALQIGDEAKNNYSQASVNAKIGLCEVSQTLAGILKNETLTQQYKTECDSLYKEWNNIEY